MAETCPDCGRERAVDYCSTFEHSEQLDVTLRLCEVPGILPQYVTPPQRAECAAAATIRGLQAELAKAEAMRPIVEAVGVWVEAKARMVKFKSDAGYEYGRAWIDSDNALTALLRACEESK